MKLFRAAISIKTRIAIAAGMLILVTASLLTAAAIFVVEHGLENIMIDRQSSLIEQVALEIDQKLALRKTALSRLALDLTGVYTTQPTQVQSALEQHHSLDGLFTNFLLFNARGEQIASMDRSGGFGKVNAFNRDYFKETLRTRASVLSQPVRGLITGRPLVAMTAPMFDTHGAVSGILVGTLDLGRNSFIKDLSTDRIGKTGYFYILNKTGTFIAHPDDARLMTNVYDRKGASPAMRLALSGMQGTIKSTTRFGIEALFSFRQLKSTDWIITAIYPTKEAFEPVSKVMFNAILIALVLTCLLVPLAWWLIGRQLVPLQQLRDRMLDAHDDATPIVVPLAHKYDEIGDLARAFDDLMRERARVARAFAESEKNLRMITDQVPALVGYVDHTERFIFCNQKYQDFFDRRVDQLGGKTVQEVVGPEIYTKSQAYIRAALNGQPARFERQIMRHGSLHWDRVAYIPDVNAQTGKVDGYVFLVEDITEMKATQFTLAASEKRIRTIADNMPALISYIDTEERYLFCNSVYRLILGVDPDKMMGRTVKEVFGDATYAELAKNLGTALTGQRTSFEQETQHDKHQYLQYEYIPDKNNDGIVIGLFIMVTDISQRKHAELTFASQERLLRAVTNNLPALVSFINLDRQFEFVNRPYEIWLGRPLSAITGHSFASVIDASELALHTPYLERALHGELVGYEFKKGEGAAIRHYQAIYTPQFDESNTMVGISGLINDVTDAKLIEHQLSVLARFDTLTGLPNRNQLNERIGDAIDRSARSDRVFAVMYLDLDKFKSINDTLGHQGGDEVLKEFALRLKSCVRQTDTVGRLSGDEFIVLLEGLHHASEATHVAQKIVQAMQRPFTVAGSPRLVTTSIGIAVSTQQPTSVEEMLKKSDEALYLAKDAGRNTYASVNV